MIRLQKLLFAYLFAMGATCARWGYAMDEVKKEGIDRKKIGEMVESTLAKMADVSDKGHVSQDAIAILCQDIPAIAQAANMLDRQKIIAESLVSAKYQRDYELQEPDFNKRHLTSQIKTWQQTMPWYVALVPYDCTVIAKQYACALFTAKKDRRLKDMPAWEHTLDATNNPYSIHDAQSVIMIGIRDYTRDFSKREDGALNASQLIECTIRFGEPHSCEHTFDICAGDAWQLLEKAMKDHLERLQQEKK